MNNIDEIKFNEMDERIERFLRGQMSPEEEEQLHEDLKNDPDLREHASVVSALVKGIREKEGYRDKCATHRIIRESEEYLRPCGMELPEDEDNSVLVESKKPSNLRRLIIWTSSIAAALVLVVGISVYIEKMRYEQTDEMLSPYYTHYDIASLSRGETDSITIAHLYTLFNRIPDERNMSAIIAELEPIYASLDDDFTYYPYANDIAWNLALAYVKAGEKEKAKEVLNKLISDSEGTPIEEKAQILLKEIEAN